MSIGSVTSAPLSSQLLTLRSFANQARATSQTSTSPLRAATTNAAVAAAAVAPLAAETRAATNPNNLTATNATQTPLTQTVRDAVNQLNSTTGPISQLTREQLYANAPSLNQSPLYASFPYERINGFVSRTSLGDPNPPPSPLQTVQSDQARQIRNQINFGNSVAQTQLRNTLNVPAGT